MPFGVFKTVREVSSEDAVHVAANLLQENAAKKWRTQTAGEKSAYVILEFETPQQITGIDIGNEHAAFVEVQVSNSGCKPDDFKELLLSCAFMTSIESKNSSNANRVRCFATDALIADALPHKWQLVKILCTQPFNKHVQYGLSFIKVHVKATATATLAKPVKTSNTNLLLKLRPESPDSDSSSSLFQRWKASRNSEVSTAAAIRDAGSPAALRRLSEVRAATQKVQSSPAPPKVAAKTESKPLDRNREALLFGADDDADDDGGGQSSARRERLSKHLEADKNRRRQELEQQQQAKHKRLSSNKESPQPRPQKRLSATLNDNENNGVGDDDVSSSAKKPKLKAEPTMKYAPFNQLLRGVVLVISGIQNPDRADLRAKAVALGAKYKADWEPGCTHLICAFRNTPKYNQVKGKGKIVTRSWIEKCYALKKYLPWRRYALETAALGQPESDEEIFDESLKPAEDNDVKIVDIKMQQRAPSSDPDTEDELERVAQQKKLRKPNDENRNNNGQKKAKNHDDSNNVYEVSTDEEDYLQQMRRK